MRVDVGRLDGGPSRDIWITPGGGAEDGESAESSLRRELHEETGLVDFTVGPLIWTRSHAFPMNGVMVVQRERIYLVEVSRYEPVVHHLEPGDEEESFCELRWWHQDEIRASSEVFVPGLMARHLDELVAHGPPGSPVDVGR